MYDENITHILTGDINKSGKISLVMHYMKTSLTEVELDRYSVKGYADRREMKSI